MTVLTVGTLLVQAQERRTLRVAQAPTPATTKSPSPAAAAFLKQVQERLAMRQSIQVDIEELVHLTDPPTQLTGRYLSAGLKSRLEYNVDLRGGVKGGLLEVCDGERLWSVLTLPGSKRVTRRDVRQILTALESATRAPSTPTAELALGGLPGLLAGLQRSMVFDALKEETVDGRALVIVQGRWKPELLQRLGISGSDAKYPPHIPELVRIEFGAESLFPERLVYLQRPPEKKFFRPIAVLKFQNVMLDAPVEDTAFNFTPPDNVEPEDVTRQFLEQLLPAPAKPDAKK